MSAPVMTVEEMLERLRREAEVRGPGWLQEQVGACMGSPAPVATPNARAARPRRSIPPARLSPEVTPRARRRVGSPPVDPRRRRAAAQPSASRSRRGRNPDKRRGPVSSGTPLPPLPAAVQLDSGPGTVDRPSPSFSGRSTRRFDEVRVPRTALVVDEYQRRSREDLSSVEEGPLAVVEAAVSSRCPASVVQRVVQAVQEEQPSTSRSYDGAVSVRQESGSTAAGVTAPVVPGRMMAALVWILGHSYVFWGAIRADVRPSGRQLGVSPELATVRWLGVRGMLWGGVLREVHHFVRLDRPPNVLVSAQKLGVEDYGTAADIPGHGRNRKINDKLKKWIIQMVTEEPRTTCKEIRGALQGQGTSVSDQTIRHCLSQTGLHGRQLRRRPLLKANPKKARLEFAKMHIDKPQSVWENLFWTDETKLELFEKSHQPYVHR
ncbi:uncharacterized protein LOC120999069 [Bufo bufo]|uniref:uncharacterized protein LOC120999069 n=1 Tax=Bufo bufo TaxID=8384 RepID=UPI001ABEDDFC|nr:uncharacterized protein LOC120999069 [Bufo bufo]